MNNKHDEENNTFNLVWLNNKETTLPLVPIGSYIQRFKLKLETITNL